MAAAIPIFLPPSSNNPVNFAPVGSPSRIEQVWDQAVMALAGDDYIDINVDAFVGDLGINTLVEVEHQKTIKVLPVAPVTMFLLSTDAGDNQPILVDYLDENQDYKSAVFIVDGLTPVELPLMYRVLSIENGSNDGIVALLAANGITTGFTVGPANGTILVHETGAVGTPADAKTFVSFNGTLTVIDSGVSMERSFSSAFTIPKGYSGYAFGFEVILGKNDEVFVAIQTKAVGGDWITRLPVLSFQNAFQRTLRPRVIPELFDLRILAKETGGTAGIPLSFNYQLILIKNAV